MGIRTFLATVLTLVFLNRAAAEDWPQFHGPRRDNRSADTGLLRKWPEGGPKLVFKTQGLGSGYSSVTIADGMIYTTGDLDKATVITALDMSGRQIWQRRNGPAYKGSHPGARSTPTVADGKLYNLSGTGNLICIDAKTGSTLWGLNILEEFGGRMIKWGISESPLVDGDNVICFPGGQEIGMVALDEDTGQTRWTCTGIGDKPSYATATIIDYHSLRQILTMTSESAIGVAAETGKLLWKYPHTVRFEANCDTPLYHDGHVYLFGTYGYGATKLKLNVRGDRCSVEKTWHTTELDNEHGGVLIVDCYLYGQADANHKQRHMACLEAATGKTMWTAGELAGRASATLTFAEGMFYVVSDRGAVALVRPNPKHLEIVSRFELPADGKGEVRARPVVCGGRLYIRHDQLLYVYDVRAK
jgi:outer membrane protein assembly factor BamB